MRASTVVSILALSITVAAATAYTIWSDYRFKRAESCSGTLRDVTVCMSEASTLEQSIDTICPDVWREAHRQLGANPRGVREISELVRTKLITADSDPHDAKLCEFASKLIADCSSIREGLRTVLDVCIAGSTK
ncbi:MAG: hypothetical protein KatS3mg054_0083 [Chloroflexus sp.]|nr:MAG: hypothetical protein KatS3mg054_0083 [Chloroflexus sp.]